MKNDRKSYPREECKTGIVTPCRWDNADRITGVMLSTTDDEEYFVENSREFIPYIHASISATGIIRCENEALKKIHIKKFNILDDFQ